MVRVLMRDQDRIQAGQILPRGGEDPWVDQDPGGCGLDEETGVAVTGDDHAGSMP
jgi:hypothetical protein